MFCTIQLNETLAGVICEECLATIRYIERPFCERCAYPFSGAITEEFTCSYCVNLQFSFNRAICACRADGIVRDVIHRFKYKKEMYFQYHLFQWLYSATALWIDWSQVDVLVPVPLHPRKYREREFNQAKILAQALSAKVGVKIVSTELRRIRDTATQTTLDAKARFSNMRDSFAISEPIMFSDQRVVLVDDVFTTGATMNSCAKVLRDAGAKEVIALAVARGI